MDAAAAPPPPAAVSRLGHEVFATSAAIRQICNEPAELTRILWGVEALRPLDDVVAELHRALPDELPKLGPSSPYYEACGHARRQFEHYRPLSTVLTLDHIKALSMYTLENPRYYDIQNKAAYCTYAGQAHKDFPVFAHVIAHINTGLHELAALHQSGRLQPRQPERLVRLAWIPDATWEQHYKAGNNVVFLAPMSTSPMWSDDAERATSPVWEFLDRPKTGHTPCLLEFDSMLARKAGQLGHPQHPISWYGAAEKEWTLPSYIRGRVASITEVSAPGGRQATIPHVLIEGIPMLSAIKPSRRRGQTAEVLLAAVTVAMFAEHRSKEAPVTKLLRDFCGSLAKAVEVRNPDEVVTRPDIPQRIVGVVECLSVCTTGTLTLALEAAAESEPRLKRSLSHLSLCAREKTLNLLATGTDRLRRVTPDLHAIARRRNAKSSVEANARKQLSQIDFAAEEHVPQQTLKQLAREIPYKLEDVYASVTDLMGKMAESDDNTKPWLQLVAHVQYLADVFDLSPELDPILVDTRPLSRVRRRQFLEPIDRVGERLWEPAPPDEDPELHAWRAAAWLDCLRVRLATTRVLVLVGCPDAGKTTFLEQVFGIESRGGAGLKEECRTANVTFYRHPRHNTEFVPAYVVDSPGFGDSVEARNNMVRCLLHCVSALGRGVGFVWVMRAGRDVKAEADEVYTRLLPFCRLVVVTCVDRLLEERHEELEDDLEKKGFDFDDQEALAQERLRMMLSVKEEAHRQVQRLSGDQPPPPVRFAVLPPGKWASSTGSSSRTRRPAALPWDTAKEDVMEVFQLLSAGALRELLDAEMGIPQ